MALHILAVSFVSLHPLLPVNRLYRAILAWGMPRSCGFLNTRVIVRPRKSIVYVANPAGKSSANSWVWLGRTNPLLMTQWHVMTLFDGG